MKLATYFYRQPRYLLGERASLIEGKGKRGEQKGKREKREKEKEGKWNIHVFMCSRIMAKERGGREGERERER